MRRIAAPLAAILVAAPVLMGITAAGADEGTAGRIVVPDARGSDPGQGAAENNNKNKQKPCPQELWTIPLQVEGLACILLLPKKEEQQKNQNGKDSSESDDSGPAPLL